MTAGGENGCTSCGGIIFRGDSFVSGSPLHARIVALIGEGPLRRLFSLLSLIGIVWLSRAYGQAEYIQLWGKPYALRPFALVVMLAAFFFVVLAFTSPNPTAVGGETLLAEKEPAKGVQRITRHPFLWGVTLWSFTHLILNGDLASVIFFGSFLVLAIEGPVSIDRKREKAVAEAWHPFARLTSNVPFVAIIQGRNALHLGEIGWWSPLLAVILYGLLLYFHRNLFGVSPLL